MNLLRATYFDNLFSFSYTTSSNYSLLPGALNRNLPTANADMTGHEFCLLIEFDWPTIASFP